MKLTVKNPVSILYCDVSVWATAIKDAFIARYCKDPTKTLDFWNLFHDLQRFDDLNLFPFYFVLIELWLLLDCFTMLWFRKPLIHDNIDLTKASENWLSLIQAENINFDAKSVQNIWAEFMNVLFLLQEQHGDMGSGLCFYFKYFQFVFWLFSKLSSTI